MFILIGEKIKTNSISVGAFTCPCCEESRDFSCVTNKSYFCLCFIPILPIKVESEYWECSTCCAIFKPEDLTQASYIPIMKDVLSYLLTGYGLSECWDSACEVYEKLCDETLDKAEIIKLKETYHSKEEFLEALKKQAFNLEHSGAVKIIQAAYLFTYAVGEIQFNERFRINLIGNAINIDIESINGVIAEIKQLSYMGIQSKRQIASEDLV